MSGEIRRQRSGSVLELRFDRPDRKNAITPAMYAALADGLRSAEADEDILVVTLSGSEGIFTAGNDLRDFQETSAPDSERPVAHFLEAISTFPKVIVAGVSGPAVGVGTTMLLHCDLVLAAPSALFSLPFVDLGLVPEAASSLLLPRLIGHQRAAKHLILGDPFDAETALLYGLVAEIVDEEALDVRVRETAGRIAAKPPEAVRLTKKLLRGGSSAVAERIAQESALFGERLKSPEAAEAFAAFFEKRPPNFSR